MVHFYKNRKKVAIITVVDEETKAVIDEFDLKKINNEDINLKSSRIFYGGNLETSNGGIELYQSTCLNQGNVAAAELTRAIQQLIKPDLYVLLGVAGSLNEHELEECDVIIAKQVFDGQTVKETETDGTEVIITAAGMAAALPGVVASQTVLPVIGVPISGSTLDGMDALLSIVQMPSGIPVATVAINGSKNAAYLALQIMAIKHDDIKEKLVAYRKEMEAQAMEANVEVMEKYK